MIMEKVTKVVWSDEYSTGNKEIDKQHKDLFDFIDKLDLCLEQELYFGPQVDALIGFLTAYTKSHFIYEEMCMRSRLCPVKEKNEKAHGAFIQYYQDFIQEYRYSDAPKELLEDLSQFLKKWLVDHICKIDVHLRDCIYGKVNRG